MPTASPWELDLRAVSFEAVVAKFEHIKTHIFDVKCHLCGHAERNNGQHNLWRSN